MNPLLGTASVDLADGIFVLQHLFQGGAAPPCEDAADADDDGRLNLLDAIWIFHYSIGNVASLPFPFFFLGIDPTTDTLGCSITSSLLSCQP